MSKEAAKEFVKLVLKEDELAKRMEGLMPEEATVIAKEKGFDITEEELKEALMIEEQKELDGRELEQVAGGTPRQYWGGQQKTFSERFCRMSPDSHHKYKYTGHKEEYHSFIITWSNGFDILTCIYCNKRKLKRVF